MKIKLPLLKFIASQSVWDKTWLFIQFAPRAINKTLNEQGFMAGAYHSPSGFAVKIHCATNTDNI